MSLSNLTPSFYYKKSRIQQLKGFCYTIQLGSTIKASQKMGLGNNTVSMQIKSLERDLNTKLFDRKNGRLIANKDGALLYKLAIPILQSFDGLFERFKCKSKNLKNNSIKIAAYHSAMSYIIPQYIKKFQQRYPNVKIILQDIKKEEAFKRIINQETDLAIYPTSKIPDECYNKNVFNHNPTILVHKDNPLSKKSSEKITMKDLSEQQVISIDKRKILPYFARTCEEFDIGGNIEFENGDWEIIRNFVKMNIGICLFGDLYDKMPIFQDEYIISKKINHLYPVIKYGIVTKRGLIPSKIVKDFIGLIDGSYFD